MDRKTSPDIEYHGTSGITDYCIKAITRIIHFGDIIKDAKLLSYFDDHTALHSFLITLEHEQKIIIKTGFASGYGGEGPKGLSTALQLLQAHEIPIDEYVINKEIYRKIDTASLNTSDLTKIESLKPVRPIRFYDYILDENYDHKSYHHKVQRYFPPSIHFGLIDSRLLDLALTLFNMTDHSLNTAFRRLEDILRERTNINEHGVKLFSKAFEGSDSILHWNDTNEGEHNGKANLFKAIFLVFRNPRAHKELTTNDQEAAREFLLINQLYILEKQAVTRKLELSPAGQLGSEQS